MARILLAIVCRMHREPVRSPARSVANLEFHHTADRIDEVAREIVRRLEDRGIRELNPSIAFPMEMVGAIKPDGYFDFSACLTHNYQQFMGGFVNWVEDIAESGSARDYRDRVPYAETVKRWQSISYGPNYNAAYCIAVCPAGEDVLKPYLADRKTHLDQVVRPLQNRVEPIYVVKGSNGVDPVTGRFPHKRIR